MSSDRTIQDILNKILSQNNNIATRIKINGDDAAYLFDFWFTNERFKHILISMVKISRHTYNSVKNNGRVKLYGEKHRELDNINLGILKVGKRLVSLINNPDDLSGTKKTEEIIINMEYYEDEKLYKLVEYLGKKVRLII